MAQEKELLRLNLSSSIVLNQVQQELYRPSSEVLRSEITQKEKIHTDIYETVDDGAQTIAREVAAIIRKTQQEGRQCAIGVGTGLSLSPIYAALVQMYDEDGLSFENVVIVNAYEYYPIVNDTYVSSVQQLHSNFLDFVNVKPENVLTPDGTLPQEDVSEFCRNFEERIKQLGGIDVMLLGIGRLGNIAANEPGSSLTSTSRIILVDTITRKEMADSCGQFSVPPCAITVGVKTILDARRIFLAAWGDEKADIIQRTVEGDMTDAVPATFLQTHNNIRVVIDLPAAAKLTRIIHPWLVTSCQWTDKLVRSALVWLCQKTGKPILKLTNKDYNENGLSELLALYGAAYNANIKIFNDLQHTITGWPGGKPDADDTNRPERALPYPKRVIIFSPHPDDDVVSMGGTLQRLVKQHHDVHVAYETSGNIAVCDEEVTRFMHFINGFNQLFEDEQDEVIKHEYQAVKCFFKYKVDGDVDTQDIRTLKGLIRRGEARIASTFNGIPLDHVHFLDLPFYESGTIEKLPVTAQDVAIARKFIASVKPHQIYVAGDLADPHGTHRKCTDIVLAALDLEKQAGAEWLKGCRVWMYRGAWAEWEIENIEMCVPMSPEELRMKRNAILKHQSQMESAPYLGSDERLFWQRAEDRNRATAALYDSLGLASYEAMEAFVEYKP